MTILVTPVIAQYQRIISSSGNFSIIAPLNGWELILNKDDILIFRSPTKETVMTFKKMPKTFPDLEAFVNDYKNNIEANGKVTIIPQESGIINGVKTSRFKLNFKKPNELAPGTEGQVYLLLKNNSAYFFESFGFHVHSEHSDLFNNMAKSFKLNESSN